MIDYIVLTAVTPFSAIAQQNKGWVGVLQSTAMDAIDCIAFNRTGRGVIENKHSTDVESSPPLPPPPPPRGLLRTSTRPTLNLLLLLLRASV